MYVLLLLRCRRHTSGSGDYCDVNHCSNDSNDLYLNWCGVCLVELLQV